MAGRPFGSYDIPPIRSEANVDPFTTFVNNGMRPTQGVPQILRNMDPSGGPFIPSTTPFANSLVPGQVGVDTPIHPMGTPSIPSMLRGLDPSAIQQFLQKFRGNSAQGLQGSAPNAVAGQAMAPSPSVTTNPQIMPILQMLLPLLQNGQGAGGQAPLLNTIASVFGNLG